MSTQAIAFEYRFVDEDLEEDLSIDFWQVTCTVEGEFDETGTGHNVMTYSVEDIRAETKLGVLLEDELPDWCVKEITDKAMSLKD